jgi:hypothetical protein
MLPCRIDERSPGADVVSGRDVAGFYRRALRSEYPRLCKKTALLGSRATACNHAVSHLGRSRLGRSHLGRSHVGRSHLGRSHLGRSHVGRSHYYYGVACNAATHTQRRATLQLACNATRADATRNICRGDSTRRRRRCLVEVGDRLGVPPDLVVHERARVVPNEAQSHAPRKCARVLASGIRRKRDSP